jgi:BRCT domain type II-containing protein
MSAHKAAKLGKPARSGKSAAPAKAVRSVKPATSAASTGSNSDTSTAAKNLAAEIDQALAKGNIDLLSADAIQALMAAVCRSYSARVEAGGQFSPLGERSRVTSTDVMVTASGLLKSANLAVFELGMWQSWTGR